MSVEVLMFTGPDCAACKVMKPLVKELPNHRIVDVTQDHALVGQYRIRGGLPVFVKLVDGNFDSRKDGAMSTKELNDWAAQ